MPLAARLLIVLIGLAACIPPTVTTTTAATSTTAASTTTVAVMACGYALFDGTAGGRVSTPNHTSLNITGDIDLRVLAWIDTRPGDFLNYLISKGSPDLEPTLAAFSWFEATIDGSMAINWRQDNDLQRITSTSVIAVENAWRWYRLTLDVNNGAGGITTASYYSDQSPETAPAAVSWTLRSSFAEPGTTDIQSSVDEVWIGGEKGFQYNQGLLGRIGYAEIRAGINGVIAASVDFRNPTQKTGDAPTRFTDATGKVWTFVATAVWVPGDCGGGGGQDENRMGGTGAIRKPPRTR